RSGTPRPRSRLGNRSSGTPSGRRSRRTRTQAFDSLLAPLAIMRHPAERCRHRHVEFPAERPDVLGSKRILRSSRRRTPAVRKGVGVLVLLAGLVVATGTNPVGAATPGPPNKYYFAEGTTRAGFATILFLLNSNAAPLQVHLVFADSTGTRTEADVTVSGQTEVGVVPRNYVGNDKDFAIEAEGSR